ncbi:MAG: hypothetical protein HY851_07650 [candidate division Zixibacteria bacterium]|nr:hypothetical protein [candidate division Zixibacteria bacterium]
MVATLLVAVGRAADHSSARAAAMSGAFTVLASGPTAPRFNPANLGLSGRKNSGVEFFGLGASITNNSFTLGDYNKYTGAYLTSTDKQDILGKVPSEGLKLSVDVDATTMATAFGHFALSVEGSAAADMNLSKDVINLLLNGNTYADTIDVTGSYSSALSYGSVGISYGLPVFQQGSRQLAVGLTGKYLRGIGIEEVTDLQGGIATYSTGFQGAGHVIARTATGGSGYAVDLGAAMTLNKTYACGLKIESFLSHIQWNKETQERGYLFSFDTVTIANSNGDFVVSDNYTKDIPAFTTTLPARMTVGFGKTSGRLLWAVDWEQGFRSAPGASTKPRLAAGAEYSLISFLPLRAGYAVGGNRSASLSFGSGLKFGGFYLDAAAVAGSSFSGYSSRGINVAFATGLQF